MKASAPTVRVAVGQHNAQPGQWDRNVAACVALAQRAASMGATLILLPEMNLCGYEVQTDWQSHVVPASHPALARVQRAAVDHKIAIAAGYIERWERGVSINHTVYKSDGTRAFQRKSGGPGGPEHGCVGDMTRTVIPLGDIRLGIIICADGSHEPLWNQLREQGANLIAWCSAGSDYWAQDIEQVDAQAWDRTTLLGAHARRNMQAKAIEMGLPLLASNLVGRTPHVAWPGNSGVIDAEGSILAWIPEEALVTRMKPGVVVADVTVKS